MAHLKLPRYTEQLDPGKPGGKKEKTAVIQHLIFGLDDVIIDTENAGFEAFKFALEIEKQKTDISPEEHHELFSKEVTDGERFRKFLSIKQAKEASPEDNDLIARLCKQKEDKKHKIIRKQFLAGNISAIPGAIDLIQKLQRTGIKLAITSDNIYAADILHHLGILDQFEVCVQRKKDEISGQYHYVTVDTQTKFTLSEDQKLLPQDSFAPCAVQFAGEPWPWRFFDTARRMGANPFNCGVVTGNPHIDRENFELGFGASIFADTTHSYDKAKSRSGTVCTGDTKESVIAQLSKQLLDKRVLSDSPTLTARSDVYNAIESSSAAPATAMAATADVPCVKLDRYAPIGIEPEKANIRYFLWDVEGCIIDSVPAQIKSFREAIKQIQQEYLSRQIALITQQLCGVVDDRARTLEQQIKALSEVANKLSYLTDGDYHKLISGRSRDGGFRNVLGIPRKEDATDVENTLIKRLCDKKDEIFQQMLVDDQIKAFPAVVDMIKKLHTSGIKMAFASGSSNAAMMLHKASILDLFEVGVQKGRGKYEGLYVTVPKPAEAKLAAGETEFSDAIFKKCDVEFHGKPMPWIFYKAAHKMGANPYECVVIEDAPSLTEQYYEAGFSAAIGVDTGGAFNKEAIRAGTVFYRKLKDSAKRVAKAFAEHVVSKIAKTTESSTNVYGPVHTGHDHHHAGKHSPAAAGLFGKSANQQSAANGASLLPSTGTEGPSSSSPANN